MKSILNTIMIALCITFYSGHSLASPNSILNFKRIGQVVVSPNGKHVAYSILEVTSTKAGKQWQTSLFVDDQNTSTLLVGPRPSITSLTWSADGKKVGYIAKGHRFQSIWSVDIKTRHNNKLFEFNSDIEDFKWSPNNKDIAFVATETKSLGRILKPRDVNKQEKIRHLYLIKNNKAHLLSSPHESISSITEGFDWSPKGHSLVYSHQPKNSPEYWNESAISILDLKTKKTTPVAFSKDHTGVQPVFSHNGNFIAFRSNLEPRTEAATLNDRIHLQGRVCVFNTLLHTTTCLANTFNENPFILGWSKKDDKLYLLDAYKTAGFEIYELALNPDVPAKNISHSKGFIEPLTISLNQSGQFFGFGYETITSPPEVYIATINPFKLKQISKQQDKQTTITAKISTIRWHAKDGHEIEGLLITPNNYNPKKKYPLFVSVHGGPAGVWRKRYLGGCAEEYGQMIDPTSCWGPIQQLGFLILAPNPRGSTGYGTQYRLANFADLGGQDYHDIMAGVNYLIKKGYVNSKHLAIGGWSFGGYMSAWAISQTNRFKAAIDGDGNTNFISFSGTSDAPNYYESYLGNSFWEKQDLYLQRAPIMFVQKIKTPLLILSGEKDQRVPISQSYELYRALERQHKPVKMLVLPEQGHVPTDPNIIVASLKAIDNWLAKAL